MFWKLLALYIASNTLSSLYWAIPFGPAEVNTMRKQAADILSWYDDMKTPVPSWYFSGYYLQELDGIPYKLKRPFDFSFLHEYGSVFRIYDDQDSGNICFGVEKEGKRFDLVILDPPAFTKSRSSIKNAVKGYREINLRGMKLVKDGGYLATCSCSHFMDPELFSKTIREAAGNVHKRLRQAEYKTQAPDHPILWAADESYYLKFYIFQVVEEK